jgi:hypothetical protein
LEAKNNKPELKKISSPSTAIEEEIKTKRKYVKKEKNDEELTIREKQLIKDKILFFGDESQEYKEWLKNLPTETKWKRGDRVQIIPIARPSEIIAKGTVAFQELTSKYARIHWDDGGEDYRHQDVLEFITDKHDRKANNPITIKVKKKMEMDYEAALKFFEDAY